MEPRNVNNERVEELRDFEPYLSEEEFNDLMQTMIRLGFQPSTEDDVGTSLIAKGCHVALTMGPIKHGGDPFWGGPDQAAEWQTDLWAPQTFLSRHSIRGE